MMPVSFGYGFLFLQGLRYASTIFNMHASCGTLILFTFSPLFVSFFLCSILGFPSIILSIACFDRLYRESTGIVLQLLCLIAFHSLSTEVRVHIKRQKTQWVYRFLLEYRNLGSRSGVVACYGESLDSKNNRFIHIRTRRCRQERLAAKGAGCCVDDLYSFLCSSSFLACCLIRAFVSLISKFYLLPFASLVSFCPASWIYLTFFSFSTRLFTCCIISNCTDMHVVQFSESSCPSFFVFFLPHINC